MESTRNARSALDGLESGIPEEYRAYVVPQRHSTYTRDDHRVWREVLSRNEALVASHGKWMHCAYSAGMRQLALPPEIPRIEALNERIAPSGWRTVCVDGYVPTSAYVGLMSKRIFPVSRKIRRPEHIDFAPAPDMVHDILGHLPMLFLPEHRNFLERLAVVMSRAKPNALDHEFYEVNTRLADLKMAGAPENEEFFELEHHVRRINRALVNNASQVTRVRRMYVWSVEFGLMGNADHFEIYGAGLISAPTEFRAVCQGAPILPFSMDVIHYENAFSDLLEQYFVARDFEHLDSVLAEYEREMQASPESPQVSQIRELVPPAQRARSGHA